MMMNKYGNCINMLKNCMHAVTTKNTDMHPSISYVFIVI